MTPATRNFLLRWLPGPVLCALSAVAIAADVSEAEMRARIDRASAAAARAAEVGSGPVSPKIENLPQPSVAPAPIDVEALARQIEASARPPRPARPSLLAFVSFSMPQASLARLVADAESSGTTLVLRGLVEDSLQKTIGAAQSLIGRRSVAWVIDPDAFKRFRVTAVPSYVLIRAGAQSRDCAVGQCFGDADYVRLAGDVPIDYALEKIALGAPGFAGEAALLRRGGQ